MSLLLDPSLIPEFKSTIKTALDTADERMIVAEGLHEVTK